MKYRLAEIRRGYETGEYSHPTRDHSGLRLTDSESATGQSGTAVPTAGTVVPTVGMYAERNGELHVLCHEMLNALEYLGCDYDILHKFRSRLHDVPQCRVVR